MSNFDFSKLDLLDDNWLNTNTIDIFKEYFLPYIDEHEDIEYIILPKTNYELYIANSIAKYVTQKEFFTLCDELYNSGFDKINIHNINEAPIYNLTNFLPYRRNPPLFSLYYSLEETDNHEKE